GVPIAYHQQPPGEQRYDEAKGNAAMRSVSVAVAALLCLCAGCLPLRCSHHEGTEHLGILLPADLSVGDFGRPQGTPCDSVDQCNSAVADTWNARCQCG